MLRKLPRRGARRDHDEPSRVTFAEAEYVISVRLSALQRRLCSSYIDWLHTCALDKEMTLFRHSTLLTKVWSHPSLLQIGTVDDDPGWPGEDNDIGAASGGSRARLHNIIRPIWTPSHSLMESRGCLHS